MPYTMNRDEYRQWCRLERAERARKDRKAAKAQRKAYWGRLYWSQMLRFDTFKVGGLRFIKLGTLSVSICVSKPREIAQ